MSFLVQRNMVVQGSVSVSSLRYANNLVTTTDFTGTAVNTTTGTVMMLSRNINIIKLPFVNDVNTTIPNGTCYRIYYTTASSETAIVFQSGDDDILFKGLFMHGGSRINISENSNILVSFTRYIGDTIDLLYYENTWYVKGLLSSTTPTPAIGTNSGLPAIESIGITDFMDQFTITTNVTDTGGANKFIIGMSWNLLAEATPTIEVNSTKHINRTSDDDNSAVDITLNLTDVSGDEQETPLHGRAFILNSKGVSYTTLHNFELTLCLLRGTMIQLVDGQKSIEDITYEDVLVVWDFDSGSYATAKPLWIKRSQKSHIYNKLTFSNKTTLCTVSRHRIFNKEAGSFTYPMTDATPIGTTTFSYFDKEVTLISKEYVTELIDYYNIITDRHINLFANGILTSCRYNNIYPIHNMKFQKDDRQIRAYDETIGIPRIYYDGLRVGEQSMPIEHSKKYIDRLIRTEHNVPRDVLFLDHQGVMYLDKYPNNNEIKNFNEIPVTMVKQLLKDHPSLDIVVSSDWKYRVSLPTMQLFYLSQGLKAPIDYTPKNKSSKAHIRADEIKEWLHNNETHKWISVDDLDMRNFLDNFVWVKDINNGFDAHIYEQVCERLKSP